MNEMMPIERMKKDIRQASGTMSRNEVRFLVDAYYQMQEDRIKAQNRVRSMVGSEEPHAVIRWLEEQFDLLERQIKGSLDLYSMQHPVGNWMRGIKGVGPVISAGFLANLNLVPPVKPDEAGNPTPLKLTAGRFWSVCGLAPGKDRRVKGEKTQFNPDLKRLCFLTGECFKRLRASDPDAYYRQIYDQRKNYEIVNNQRGCYREQAEKALEMKNYSKDTTAKEFYEKGMLPPAQIDRRACRYAVKLFLSHLHEVWHKHEFGVPPPIPYPMAYLEHPRHLTIPPPKPVQH
jgi:hypothetical protein